MQLDGNGFFGDLKDLFEENNTSFFKTDIKTILGRNLVKNFLGQINFEIGMFGYSDTANDIAEFYSECLKNGGIVQFSTNAVIKMILEEIQYMPKVRNYLKDRIFDDIEREKIESLNKTFENNEEIKEKLDKENIDFVKQKISKEKDINKIMKQRNCNREQAEKIYQDLQSMKENIDLLKGSCLSLFQEIDLQLPKKYISLDEEKGSWVEDTRFKPIIKQDFKNNEEKDNTTINLDEEDKELEIPFTENDNFWGE